MELTLDQSPDHVVSVGQTVMVDGDPYIVTAAKPDREAPSFLDWGSVVTPSQVVITVERFDGYPA